MIVAVYGLVTVAICASFAQNPSMSFDQALQLLNDHCFRRFGDASSGQCRLQTNRYCHKGRGATGGDEICFALAVVQHQNSLDPRNVQVGGVRNIAGESNGLPPNGPSDDPKKSTAGQNKRWRVKKAEKARIKRLNALINKKAEKRNELIQSDPDRIRRPARERNPNATKQHSELSVNNAEEYFQGDLELSDTQAQRLEEDLTADLKDEPTGHRNKRKIGKEPLYQRWKELPISFDFATNIPEETKAKIRDAIKLWEENTCIRFKENGPNTDRVEFYDGGSCSSYVGRTGGTQGISIATPGCDYVGIIAHEIGHSLGSFHEQARPDQDSHISVNYGNIPIGRWNNFQPVDANEAETYDLPYDVGSVMHYGGFGFAINPNTPSINTNDENSQDTIGQRVAPSFLDYAAVNTAYGCSNRCPTIACQHGGYANPNKCEECLCPDGFGGKLCDTVQLSTCGGQLQASKEPNFISSPEYPNSFTKGSKCVWLIKAQPGFKVFFEFVETFEFQCEETCDKSYVEVKQQKDFRLTGYRFCCSKKPTKQFESETDEMVVILDGKEEPSTGFKAKYWSNGGDLPAGQVTETTQSQTVPPSTTVTTEASTEPPVSGGNKTNPPDCECSGWDEWSEGCSQKCGGCGSISRKRKCNHEKCFDLEKRKCNFDPCPKTTTFLLNNHEFHLLWQGCCVGLFERDGKCGGLQNNGKGFIELLSGLFQDAQRGSTAATPS